MSAVLFISFRFARWGLFSNVGRAGLRGVSVLPESVAAAAKQLKQPEALVREKALFCLRALVDGAAGVGSSVHGDALKAAVKSAGDR